MNEVELKNYYPHGVPYRTPRPRGTLAGAALGGLVGLLLSRNAEGTLAGSAIGGILANQPPALPDALRQKFEEKGYPLVQFYRVGRFGAKIAFKFQNMFVVLKSNVPERPDMNQEQIDDWLFGDLTEQQFNTAIKKLQRDYGT